MNLLRRQFLQVAVGAAALPTSSRFAWAQAYPARPVRMIVPFGPGGNADVFGRIIAQKVSEQIGKQFYVENISGAGGPLIRSFQFGCTSMRLSPMAYPSD